MRLLLGGVILSLSLSSLIIPKSSLAQTKQQASNPQIAAMVEALRLAAPKTGKTNDGLYSEWQVKPETLKGWSRTCLKKEVTPTQFENDPKLAREVVSCITRRELNNQLAATGNNETAAVRGAACWWMTGSYSGCNQGFTADYVNKVVGYYKQQSK
ncbi:MAG: hypothetical protein SAK29_17575 [Scytonema sp. PMC 1069.18]|nr:hypothetical protein [Scytonema sp. PMC 1069.18]MEC4882863.1 hypothetical protein [Scytonema sp. PMC 1070.18]